MYSLSLSKESEIRYLCPEHSEKYELLYPKLVVNSEILTGLKDLLEQNLQLSSFEIYSRVRVARMCLTGSLLGMV